MEASGILPASTLLPQVYLKHSMGIEWNGEERFKKGLDLVTAIFLSFFPRSFLVKVLCLVCLVYLSYFIKPYIFICNRGILHYSLCLTKAKYHGCHWLLIIIADGFIIQIFPKRAGRSIAAPLSYWYPGMLIVRNILCLDGGKILVIKTQPTAGSHGQVV